MIVSLILSLVVKLRMAPRNPYGEWRYWEGLEMALLLGRVSNSTMEGGLGMPLLERGYDLAGENESLQVGFKVSKNPTQAQ